MTPDPYFGNWNVPDLSLAMTQYDGKNANLFVFNAMNAV